ncbi:hypothetical protein GCM10027299_17230 [Larkinella ripae]
MAIDADIYGIMPNAKMDALLKAPPENVSSNPSNPCGFRFSFVGSIPGNTI